MTDTNKQTEFLLILEPGLPQEAQQDIYSMEFSLANEKVIVIRTSAELLPHLSKPIEESKKLYVSKHHLNHTAVAEAVESLCVEKIQEDLSLRYPELVLVNIVFDYHIVAQTINAAGEYVNFPYRIDVLKGETRGYQYTLYVDGKVKTAFFNIYKEGEGKRRDEYVERIRTMERDKIFYGDLLADNKFVVSVCDLVENLVSSDSVICNNIDHGSVKVTYDEF